MPCPQPSASSARPQEGSPIEPASLPQSQITQPHPESEEPPSQIFGPSLPYLPNTGITGPIPKGFDFDSRMIVPEGITCFSLPLGIRIQHNVGIKQHNDGSIAWTVDVMAMPVPRPPDMDIRPPLMNPFYYSDEEVEELVNSQALCEALGPFAPSLNCQIASSQAKIHTKFVHPFGVKEQSGEKVQLLDLAKMISLWGNDDLPECLSPLHFIEASKNLAALQLLCKAPTISLDALQPPISGLTNYAIEYERHLSYFRQINDFEDTYPYWYKFKKEAHMNILLSNVVFNWSKYAAHAHIILQT
ncbi:hypothetical protein C0992_002074 [Termitomyces sp. T32_za158]|nr:hypothetical protein C0992_002074 [Termitomyces sp. T32_za158]